MSSDEPPAHESAAPAQPPLSLILARNLLSTVALPAIVIGADGVIESYNDAAGALIGFDFQEVGRLPRAEWAERVLGEDGAPVDPESLPVAVAVRDGRPAHGRFQLRTAAGPVVPIEASALPLTGPGGFDGAIVAFWPLDEPPAPE